ncbi:MAG: hypothetical protein IH936_06820 [Acidobacteria bacterium]|nr:hypothetical protein [Acidobacteriota bacterium]
MRTGRERTGTVFCWIAVSALLLTVLALPSEVAARALECNSDISISFAPAMPAVGGATTVTLTMTNGLSRDLGDANVSQDFQTVNYFPACLSTNPCNPDPALPATFVASSESTSCGPGAMTASVMPDGQIDLDFGLLGFQLAASGGSCTISFDVMIDPAAMDGATINSQADTGGTCNIPVPPAPPANYVSSAIDTAQYTLVPTLGTIALAILGLLLAVGSWQILRRRQAAPLA